MGFFESFKIIFSTFFANGLKTRKMQVFWIFSLIPVLIALVFMILEIASPTFGSNPRQFYSNSMMVYFIQLLLPVLAIFSGSSIVTDEIENRTLVYLTTSMAPKTAIFLGKYTAYYVLQAIMLSGGFLVTFLLTHFSDLGQGATWISMARFIGILLLALLSYSALFSLLGTWMRKSVIIGFFFVFGWESIVQYFPGTTQRFTLIHYIKSLLPFLPQQTKFLVFQLEPSPAGIAIATLVAIAGICLVAAAIIFRHKEYLISDSL